MHNFQISRFLFWYIPVVIVLNGSLLSQERMPVIKDELRDRPAGGQQELPSQTNPSGSTDVLVNNNNGAQADRSFTQSETSILAFGNYVVIAFNDAGSYTGSNNKFTGWAYSTNGGATFIDGGSLPTSTIGDAGDPVLARNEITGRIYLSTLGFNFPYTIQMWRSDDNGMTWMAPVNATPGGGGGYGEDKQWHTVDNFPGTGNGNVYLVTRNFGSGSGIFFYRSTDHGATFGPSGGINIVSGNQGAFVAVGPDHTVYVFWWASGSPTDFIRMRKSTDFGQTFGPAIDVATGLVGGVNGDLGLTGRQNGITTFSYFRSNSFPHVAINPVNGHIYVTYNDDGPGPDKADVFLTISTDGGMTWSTRVRVNDDQTTTDQWQPTIAVTPNGTGLGIFYYSRQDDDELNNLFKYYGRIGAVAGTTVIWAPSFAVSEIASLPEFGRDAVISPVYMGDYNHVTATAEAFHVVWSDNRDDHPLPGGAPRKDPNVYYKKVPIIDVTVFQRLQDNTQVGTIGRWNGSSFNPRFSSGQQLAFRLGSTEVLHAEINIMSAQKYHRWFKGDIVEPDVKNHHAFDIESGFPNNLTSRFHPTDPTITIKTDLIDLPGTTGGNIQFRDPWYIDSVDASHGNNLMNRGMQHAVYRTRESTPPDGFKPNFDTPFPPQNHPYRGVFLNQVPDPNDPNKPYYSVGAPNPNTIGGFTAYFQNWTGANVTYRSANKDTSAIVFTGSNATAVAKYKAHLASNSTAALALSSQRKIVRDHNGTYHMVYESAGHIWYTQSTDGGATWRPEIQLNPPDYQPSEGVFNRYPSIAFIPGQTPTVMVVWEAYREEYGLITRAPLYCELTPGGLIIQRENLLGMISNSDGLGSAPGIGIGRTGHWRTGFTYYPLILWYAPPPGQQEFNAFVRIGSNWEYQYLPELANVPHFSVAPFTYSPSPEWEIAYVSGDTVYYAIIRLEGSTLSFGTPEIVHAAPGAAVSHPSIYVVGGPREPIDASIPTVVWHQSVPVHAVGFSMRIAPNAWERPAFFQECNTEATNPVVGVYYESTTQSSYIDLLWQSGDRVMRSSRWVRTPLWTPVVHLGPGSTPIISAALYTSSPTTAGWLSGSGPLQAITLSQLPLPQFEQWNAGWNIAGIAVRVPDYQAGQVFPNAIFPIYKFVGQTYQQLYANSILDSNRGYWVKFPSQQAITYTGTFIDSMAMPVEAGWNMIGSISVPVDTAAVQYTTPGMRASRFFKYQNGYVVVDRLNPGLGFWVKSSQPGFMILTSGALCPTNPQPVPQDKFIITDSDGQQQELYVASAAVTPEADRIEMPPAPPEFDARWESGDYRIVVEPSGSPIELPIAINEADFPITLDWELDPATGLEYALPDSGRLGKGYVRMSGTGQVTITAPTRRLVLVAGGAGQPLPAPLPSQFALAQNHPNPFNPRTVIDYQLPVDAHVVLKVYDLLGRVVATVVDEQKPAGYHRATFDAAAVGSGVYFYRMAAGNYTAVRKMVVVK